MAWSPDLATSCVWRRFFIRSPCRLFARIRRCPPEILPASSRRSQFTFGRPRLRMQRAAHAARVAEIHLPLLVPASTFLWPPGWGVLRSSSDTTPARTSPLQSATQLLNPLRFPPHSPREISLASFFGALEATSLYQWPDSLPKDAAVPTGTIAMIQRSGGTLRIWRCRSSSKHKSHVRAIFRTCFAI